ncbi:MAG: riboflavin synthase [Desulfomonilaceae bacterium]
MFTGIIEARGEIKGIETQGDFVRIRIASNLNLSDLKVGDSVSVDGACLTATLVDSSRHEFSADVSPETIGISTLGDFKPGDRVNLEKAMRLDSRLGGHMVAGHVDCVGRLVEKRPAGGGFLMGFFVDSGRYLVEKGSVAVDGVSLTVNRVQGQRFWVMVIPHTALLTGLTEKKINDKVNVEFDVIGKYIEKFISGRAEKAGIDEQTLREHGFI